MKFAVLRYSYPQKLLWHLMKPLLQTSSFKAIGRTDLLGAGAVSCGVSGGSVSPSEILRG